MPFSSAASRMPRSKVFSAPLTTRVTPWPAHVEDFAGVRSLTLAIAATKFDCETPSRDRDE